MIVGYIQAILYILSIIISSLWIDHIGDGVHVSLILLFSSASSMIFFNMINIKSSIKAHATIIKAFKLWVLLSFSLLIVWWLTYYAIINGSTRLFFITFPIIVAICGSLSNGSKIKTILSTLMLVSIFIIIPEATITIIFVIVASGISGFIFLKTSKIYATKFKLTAMQILSIRFYPLVVFSIILVLCQKDNLIIQADNNSMVYIFLSLLVIAFCNMVLPNYLSQSSVINIGAENFSFITSLLPVTSCFLQGIFFQDWSINIFILSAIVSIILNYNFLHRKIFAPSRT